MNFCALSASTVCLSRHHNSGCSEIKNTCHHLQWQSTKATLWKGGGGISNWHIGAQIALRYSEQSVEGSDVSGAWKILCVHTTRCASSSMKKHCESFLIVYSPTKLCEQNSMSSGVAKRLKVGEGSVSPEGHINMKDSVVLEAFWCCKAFPCTVDVDDKGPTVGSWWGRRTMLRLGPRGQSHWRFKGGHKIWTI